MMSIVQYNDWLEEEVLTLDLLPLYCFLEKHVCQFLVFKGKESERNLFVIQTVIHDDVLQKAYPFK